MKLRWSASCELVESVRKYSVQFGSSAASYSHVIDALQEDERFRTWFNKLLAEVPFDSFCWETPPVTEGTSGRPFEFVVIDIPKLALRPNRKEFAEHFTPTKKVVTFLNFYRDARLIAPCPLLPDDNHDEPQEDDCVDPRDQHYRHIGAFVRGAPVTHRDELWQRVGEVMARRLNQRPVWLSTDGRGVAWLHIRLDDAPKYYRFVPYRDESPLAG